MTGVFQPNQGYLHEQDSRDPERRANIEYPSGVSRATVENIQTRTVEETNERANLGSRTRQGKLKWVVVNMYNEESKVMTKIPARFYPLIPTLLLVPHHQLSDNRLERKNQAIKRVINHRHVIPIRKRAGERRLLGIVAKGRITDWGHAIQASPLPLHFRSSHNRMHM